MNKRAKKENMKPNMFYWTLYQLIARLLMKIKFNAKYDRSMIKEVKKSKGSVIIYNHQCDYDHMLTTALFKNVPLNYVLTKRFYYNTLIRTFLPKVKAIPREQFLSDTSSILKMRRVTDASLNLCIAPAGQETVTGMMPYIHPSIVKLLKLCKVDCYVVHMNGTYLGAPKWGKNKRKYPVSVKLEKVLTKDEIKTLSVEDCYKKVTDALLVHDFDLQKNQMIKIKGKNIAEGLENVYYVCPSCRMTHTQTIQDNKISCTNCGNEFIYNSFGFFEKTNKTKVLPKNEQDWYDKEVALIKEKLLNDDYKIESNVTLVGDFDNVMKLKDYGKGILYFDGKSFYYKGTLQGKEIKKDFDLSKVYALPWCPGVRFNVPDIEGMFEFKPENGKHVIEWVQSIEAYRLIHSEEE